MSTEPSFPKDAAVGDVRDTSSKSTPVTAGGETMGVVVSAKESKKSVEGEQRGGRNTRNIVAGAAVGVGSAALVAALLYANRSRTRSEREPGVTRVINKPND